MLSNWKEYDAYNQQRFAFLVNLGGSMKEFAGNVNEWSDKNPGAEMEPEYVYDDLP